MAELTYLCVTKILNGSLMLLHNVQHKCFANTVNVVYEAR